MTRWTDESPDACERCPVMALMWPPMADCSRPGDQQPATGKALSPTVDRLDCGWMKRLVLAERRARRLGKSATRTNRPRYDGAQPWKTWGSPAEFHLGLRFHVSSWVETPCRISFFFHTRSRSPVLRRLAWHGGSAYPPVPGSGYPVPGPWDSTFNTADSGWAVLCR